jgi:HD-like signal output (HDOD) protein
MNLPALVVEQFTGSPKAGVSAPSVTERRRQPRTPFSGSATIIRCTAGTDRTPAEARVRNLSAGGIGLMHGVRFAIGERFILVLPSGLAEIARGVLCVVANVRPSGGGFDIGATFIALLHTGTAPQNNAAKPPAEPAPLPVEKTIESFREKQGAPSAEDLTKLQRAADGVEGPPAGGPPPSESGPTKPPAAPPTGPHEITRLLTRDECIKRAEQAMESRTLSGVVAQVVALATSPRGNLADLSSLIARDPMLSARVLQAANSVSYASTRGMVSTIAEAVRNIGCATVRDIAATFGVFDAMPPSAADGFNPIRCWQHSFAVATLCQRLAAEADGGSAYLVGLCHDLGEILFHSQFGPEYRKVLQVQEATGRRRDVVERQMLGITHGELAMTILRCMSLPETIRGPIEEFHLGGISGRVLESPLARVLRVAEFYATGVLLTSSAQSPLSALTRPECRNATGKEEPDRPDGVALRGEILGLTAMLARLSAKEEAELMQPLYPKRRVPVLLVRDPSLSGFDPVEAAVDSLAGVTVRPNLPAQAELAAFAGMVVAARTTSAAGFTAPEIAKLAAGPVPVLWLTGRIDGGAGAESLVPTSWPIPLSRLAEFVNGLKAPSGATS